MIIVSDLKTITSHSVTSEASGYSFSNVLDLERPWKKWRSTSVADQTIVLNFSGDIDCISIFGCNFKFLSLTVAGWGEAPWGEAPWGEGLPESGWGELPWGEAPWGKGMSSLGYFRILDEYRGFSPFSQTPDSITITIPNQSTLGGESYFMMSAIVIGEYYVLTRKPHWSLDKNLMLPVSEITLESGSPKKAAMGDRYQNINLNRRAMNITQLNEFRDVMRTKGKIDPFIIYENLREIEKVFLVRRTSDFSYSEQGYHDSQDGMILETIT